MVWNREPVLWLALIQALIACGIGFGLKLTTEQMALVLTLSGAILAFVARGQVVPTAKLSDHVIEKAKTAALIFAPVLLLLLAGEVAAEDKSMWSLDRFSAGPKVVAQLYEFDDETQREFGFAAGAAASYNLTSRLSLNGSGERKFNGGDAVPPHWRGSAGGHLLLPNSNDVQQWFLAVERVWYRDSGTDEWTPGDWVVRLQWSFGIQDEAGHDKAFALARGRYDIDQGRRDYGVGLQHQTIGGK